MIRVLVKKSSETRIVHITVEGHAYYDKSGRDIVCSAVSAITIGIINSVESLLGVNLIPNENYHKGGNLAFDVPLIDDEFTDDRLQLLMNVMVESLLMIEKEYKKYIRIIIETS
ncbi:MAG: ribosomal-processing cysteine protease Prp [Vulcanibacillus sp.]